MPAPPRLSPAEECIAQAIASALVRELRAEAVDEAARMLAVNKDAERPMRAERVEVAR